LNDRDTHQDDRLIARALREAMPLEPASAQARERVRAAVQAQWRASLSSRTGPPAIAEATATATATAPQRRRWPLALAASVVVALVAANLSWQAVRQDAPGATFAIAEVVKGPVLLASAGASGERKAALERRGAVTTQQVVSTGADGVALLRLGEGLTLRLAANSRLLVAAAGEVSLQAGTVYVDADPRSGPQPLVVATAYGRVRHLGTQYSIRAQAGQVEIAVREGRVELAGGAAREALQAGGGEALRIEASGAVARTSVARDDARWDWLAGVPTPFELQGATLPAFLGWYGRETGRTIAFADPSGAARAQQVRLSGSIEGLSPEQALQVVAASSGLAATRDGSQLNLAFR